MKLSAYVVGSNPLPILAVLAYDLRLIMETKYFGEYDNHQMTNHTIMNM